jgi:hypothetical protein
MAPCELARWTDVRRWRRAEAQYPLDGVQAESFAVESAADPNEPVLVSGILDSGEQAEWPRLVRALTTVE